VHKLLGSLSCNSCYHSIASLQLPQPKFYFEHFSNVSLLNYHVNSKFSKNYPPVLFHLERGELAMYQDNHFEAQLTVKQHV